MLNRVILFHHQLSPQYLPKHSYCYRAENKSCFSLAKADVMDIVLVNSSLDCWISVEGFAVITKSLSTLS